VIINPAAGGARSGYFSKVVAELRRLDCAVEVRATTPAPGDAERLAREAEAEFDVIVAAGGDGTVNAVANGMRDQARPLAVIPLGTANVLAKEIAMPRDPQAVAAVIAGGEAREVWPGRVEDRLFIAMAGAGFDADVVARVDSRLKRLVGRLAFAWAILVCLRRYRAAELVVEVDGVVYPAASLVIAKGRLYGGRFVLAPAADIHVPTLHAVLFQRSGRLAVLRSLAAMVTGLTHRLPEITIVRGRSIRLSGAASAALHVDGETFGLTPAAVALADRPVRLIVPDPAARGRRR